MRKVKCENMHFFDADAMTRCPHCGAPEMKEKRDISAIQTQSPEKKKGLFGKIGKSKKDEEQDVFAIPVSGAMDNVKTEKIPTYMMTEDDYNMPSEPERRLNGEAVRQTGYGTMKAPVHEEPKAEEQNSMKTVSLFADEDGEEPTTGWLVCVKGKHYGRSFEIKTGQNCIGRDFSMDICLKKEDSVSRDKHAYIIFEPKKCMFLLRSGGGKGLTYCNDELVLDAAVLKAYDKVQLGEAEFLFVPFCGEQFMWSAE